MKTNSFKILFLVKPSRVQRNGECPVFMRITIDGQRIETTLSLSADPKKWNKIAEKVIGKDRKSQEINNRLDTIKLRIMEIYRNMELDGKIITPGSILDCYRGNDEKNQKTLLSIFKEHNERCRKLKDKDMSLSTIKRYETCYRHTEEFIKTHYSKNDVLLEEVDYQFIKDYEFFLKTDHNCNHNSTMKYLKNFKKIIRIALANEWIKKDPFLNFRMTYEEVKRDFLELHELERITKKEFKTERLMNVRDIFIFCCFTGLSFSDVKALSIEHLVRDNDGNLWIRKQRVKTDNMCNIPLLEIPKNILDKYKNHPVCLKRKVLLPVLSNQKMNTYLSEIADTCNIKKTITTHVARHTFATVTCLSNGVSMENLAKMLGHSNIKMTQQYAKVLDKSILKDMQSVNHIFSVKK